jgi:hypothetical protein
MKVCNGATPANQPTPNTAAVITSWFKPEEDIFSAKKKPGKSGAPLLPSTDEAV